MCEWVHQIFSQMLTFFDNLSATALSAKVPATWSSFFYLIFKFQCSSNLDHTRHLIFGVHGTKPYCCIFGSDHGYFPFNQTKFRKYQFKIEWNPPEKIGEKVILENIISQCVLVDQNVQEIGTTRKFCTFGSVLFRPRLVYYI